MVSRICPSTVSGWKMGTFLLQTSPMFKGAGLVFGEGAMETFGKLCVSEVLYPQGWQHENGTRLAFPLAAIKWMQIAAVDEALARGFYTMWASMLPCYQKELQWQRPRMSKGTITRSSPTDPREKKWLGRAFAVSFSGEQCFSWLSYPQNPVVWTSQQIICVKT